MNDFDVDSLITLEELNEQLDDAVARGKENEAEFIKHISKGLGIFDTSSNISNKDIALGIRELIYALRYMNSVLTYARIEDRLEALIMHHSKRSK